MKLLEILNKSENLKIVKNTPDHVRMEFFVNNNHYMVSFELIRTSLKVWELKYGTWDDTGLSTHPTGGKNIIETSTVLSTVSESIIKFIKEYDPNVIVFSGANSDKRSSIYSLMIKRLNNSLSQLGYNTEQQNKQYNDIFLIKKEDFNETF